MAKTKGKPDYDVYVTDGDTKNPYWTRIGGAWRHEDGQGFNVVLQAHPIGSRLILRVPQARDDKGTQGA